LTLKPIDSDLEHIYNDNVQENESLRTLDIRFKNNKAKILSLCINVTNVLMIVTI